MTTLPSGHNLNLEPDLLAEYEAAIAKIHAGSTTKRKLSSLRKFLDWAGEKPRPQTPTNTRQTPAETQDVLLLPPQARSGEDNSNDSIFSRGTIALVSLSLFIGILGGGMYATSKEKLWNLYLTTAPKVKGVWIERNGVGKETSGNDFISKGNIGVKIYSDIVSQTSTIYINAPEQARNGDLYIKEIRDGAYFVVGTEKPTTENITFEWLINNTKDK